jgi:NADH-quinone oxidoreductase subunit G
LPGAGWNREGYLRLVSRRTMWDGGTLVQSVPALASLHPQPVLRVHPSVLAGMGAADGEAVSVKSSHGSLTLPAVGDSTLPTGTAVLPWNLPGAHASDLIDASSAVTEVRLSSTAIDGGEADG